jgi:hypothetical protein
MVDPLSSSEQDPGLQLKTVPAAPISGGKGATLSGEAEKDIVPSTASRWKTVIDQTSDKLPIGLPGSESPGAFVRAKVQMDLEAQQRDNGVLKVPAEQLNKQYPGLPRPFNEAMYPAVADLIYSDFQRRQKLSEWSARGGGSPTGSEFLTGLAGGFLDPVNLSLGIMTGGAASALGVPASVGSIFAQNLAVNAATGLPTYLQEKKERQDVSLGDAAKQAVEGAVGGTLFHYGLHALFSPIETLKKASDIVRRTPEDIRAQNLRTVVEQHEAGLVPNLEAQSVALTSRLAGDTRGVDNPYVHGDINHPSELTYYAGKTASGAPVETQAFGPGLYGEADGARINNQVSNPGGGDPGHIAELNVENGQKFLNLDQPASTPEAQKVIKSLESALGFDFKETFPEDATLKEIIRDVNAQVLDGHLPEDTHQSIQDVVKAQGYDGYQFINDTIPDRPSHGLMLFDQNHPISGEFKANPEITPVLGDAERLRIKQAQETSGTASVNSNPEIDRQLRVFQDQASLNSTPEYMDPFVKEMSDSAHAQLDALAEQNPALKEEIDALKEQQVIGRKEQSVMKTLAECVERTLA